MSSVPNAVVSFPNGADDLDRAGHAIFGLVQKAAVVAEENVQHALSSAHNLSMQLGAAEERIVALEAEVRRQRDRGDRAEKWLHRIAMEIESKFFDSKGGVSPPKHPSDPSDYAPRRYNGQ
jgi:hypothetical protein